MICVIFNERSIQAFIFNTSHKYQNHVKIEAYRRE